MIRDSSKMESLFFLIYFFIPISVLAQITNDAYSFYNPPSFPKEISDDVIHLLNECSGNRWQKALTLKEVKKGIILQTNTKLPYKAKEGFQIESNGSNSIIISSLGIEGLEFGIYKYLRSLGFKFYLPGDLYTITPKISNIFGLKRKTMDQPFTQIRDFFGTGGFGSGNSDNDHSVQKSWNLWRVRNGFGTAYELAGHRGENFILENNNELLQHLDWLVSPKISNGKIDPETKLNYLNKQAIEFYTNWSIKPFTNPDYQLPASGVTQFVSMEPSDGGGFLTGKKIPSVSDQVFMSANVAAAKLDKLFPNNPNIGVNLYAYSSHAEPPTFPLNPRVFVQIIPYQFQNIAFGPSFIIMWADKVKRFGVYDYFKYPDAQWDLPGGASLKETMKRLIYSIKKGSEGTTYESSYSKFSTGIPLWIMGRYLSDGDANWENNLNRLTKDLYQEADQSISQLFDLFYNDPNFSLNSLTNCVRIIKNTSGETRDSKVLSRLNELKEYLYYVHLVFNSRDLVNGSIKDRLIPVTEYAWKIYESGIIDSYRIMQLASYGFLNIPKSEPEYQLYQKMHFEWFPETQPKEAAWGKIPQSVTTQKIDQDFQLLQLKYTTPSVSYSYPFSSAMEAIKGKYKPKKEFNIGGNYLNRGYFSIYTEKTAEVKINYSLTNNKQNPKVIISGIDKEYLSPIAISIENSTGQLTLKLPAGETTIFMNASDYTTYRFNIKIDNGLVFFDGSPRQILAFYKKFEDPTDLYTYDPQFFPSYIFLPIGAKEVDYKVQLNQLQIFTPQEKKIDSKLLRTETSGFEIRQFSIPGKETGKLLKAVISGNFNYSFVNIPDRYFFLEIK
ncbi:hypothetical protein SAMN02745131_00839 [Flavisolibacter ginsengisoli DSM 18119]|jgi:hypothetical protein|uniref:DUF4838 domain-containing protein n=2 Tax=Flavisolibacter TaxID=398041 RepID=A0A1M4VFC8_9BACT|nr:hypothetical protein SAMN02745131_00839 [Flavisolibacter ginsengisoli DSM 18119]